MTTALYRRYRPETFDEVIGQDHVTEPLKAALRSNRVTHAYLFSGPRGCGKTTSARILARCLNCAEGPTDTPCGVCESCRELATGGPGSLDVVEIDAASHNGVDDARELRERATFAPVRDRYKVFILDEAHMVTPQGFNALLKLVEEPPEHVKFIFATTEPERVIGTIRSRTHHYPFRLVPADVLTPFLAQLCKQESVEVGEGVLPLVVRAGGGSVRDSLSVLDQLMAGSIDSAIPYDRAVALLGYTDANLLDEAVDALGHRDGAAIFASIERMVESGHDPRRFVEDFLQRLRDLLIITVAGEDARDILGEIPSEQRDRMFEQAKLWGAPALSTAADLTDEALRAMVGATSPRLQLELLVGRILVALSGSSFAGGSGVVAGGSGSVAGGSGPAAGVSGSAAGAMGAGGYTSKNAQLQSAANQVQTGANDAHGTPNVAQMRGQQFGVYDSGAPSMPEADEPQIMGPDGKPLTGAALAREQLRRSRAKQADAAHENANHENAAHAEVTHENAGGMDAVHAKEALGDADSTTGASAPQARPEEKAEPQPQAQSEQRPASAPEQRPAREPEWRPAEESVAPDQSAQNPEPEPEQPSKQAEPAQQESENVTSNLHGKWDEFVEAVRSITPSSAYLIGDHATLVSEDATTVTFGFANQNFVNIFMSRHYGPAAQAIQMVTGVQKEPVAIVGTSPQGNNQPQGGPTSQPQQAQPSQQRQWENKPQQSQASQQRQWENKPQQSQASQ
ncbi:MAG: DNA polymerase III subunit gamma and tau, partial [Actinomycetaceae bacterium]|nr:DNA polymerase III subunit gamma and tau [Actinomycetaceae bacterium]